MPFASRRPVSFLYDQLCCSKLCELYTAEVKVFETVIYLSAQTNSRNEVRPELMTPYKYLIASIQWFQES